jgi:uncharacterized protein with HEPN domain
MRDNADKLVWLKDIVQSIDLIESYIDGLSEKEFFDSEEKQDSVVRRLEIIGEAVKNLPAEFKEQNPDVAWKEVAGMRNILAHEYFDVDVNITWNALKNHLPQFKQVIIKLIQGSK